MNEILQAIILGIVQGITEWLPVSSSGHLVIFQHFLGVTERIGFDLMVHFGSLIVVLIVFRKDIFNLIKGVFNRDRKQITYLINLIVASIPIALVGYFLNGFVKTTFQDIKLVGIFLLITSALLFATKNHKKKSKLTSHNTFFMGLAQALAIFPGISRSGSTIATGMINGIDRNEAAKFSFLMFIPAICGAIFLEFDNFVFSRVNIVGMITSIIVGYVSLKFLLEFVKKGNLYMFGWYCLILGLIVFII